jgi:hypothetical protein
MRPNLKDRSMLSCVVVGLQALCLPVQEAEFPRKLTAFDPHGEVVFVGAEGRWDRRIRERGWILRDATGYRLWYTGYAGERNDPKRLGLATSVDGVDWTRHPCNPLVGDHWVEDMMVARHDGAYYMVAEGVNDVAHAFESADGVAWKRLGPLDVRLADGKPIPPGAYGTPTVWFENGVWHLFYERGDQAVWLATSQDRKVWTNVADEPVLRPGPGGPDAALIALNQIVKHGGRYYALYHGLAQRGTRDWCTCLAVSDDLRRWRKYPKNPLVGGGKSSGVLVPDGDGFVLYTMHPVVRRHRPLP